LVSPLAPSGNFKDEGYNTRYLWGDNFAKTLLKVEKLVTTIATVAITVTITTVIVAAVIVIATAATVIFTG